MDLSQKYSFSFIRKYRSADAAIKKLPLSDYLTPLRHFRFEPIAESDAEDPPPNFHQKCHLEVRKRDYPTLKEEEEIKTQNIQSAFNTNDLMLNQIDLSIVNFYPPNFLERGIYPLKEIIQMYFPSNPIKLLPFTVRVFNALTLTSNDPSLESIFGVKWISQDVFEVNLLLYKKFNKYGNLHDAFINNGFTMALKFNNSKNTMFYNHISQHFHIGSTYQDLNLCFPNAAKKYNV